MNENFDDQLDSELDVLLGNASSADRVAVTDAALIDSVQFAAGLRQQMRVAIPSEAGIQRGRARLLAALDAGAGKRIPHRIFLYLRLRHVLMQFLAPAGLARRVAIAAAFLVACLAVNGALSASAGSLPGDPLYGVKRIQEQLRLSLTVDAAAREKLQQQIDDTRVAELNAIRRMLRVVRTEVSGTVNAIDGDTLVVDQVPFTVDHTLFPTLSNVKVGDRVTLTVQTNSDGSAVVVDLKLDTPAKPGTASVGGNGGTAIPTEALEATPRPTTAKAALTAEPPESSPPATNPAQTRAPVPSAAATSQPGGSTHGSPTPGVLKQFTAAPPSTLIGTPLPDDNQHVPTPDDFRRTPLPTSRPDITNTPSPTETRGPTQHPEATGTQRPPETPIASNTPRPTATRDATSVKELTAEPSATKSPTAAGTPDQ